MMDQEDRPKKPGGSDFPDDEPLSEPETISEEDILLGEDADGEQPAKHGEDEEATGKFDISQHFGFKSHEDQEELLPDEEVFEDDALLDEPLTANLKPPRLAKEPGSPTRRPRRPSRTPGEVGADTKAKDKGGKVGSTSQAPWHREARTDSEPDRRVSSGAPPFSDKTRPEGVKYSRPAYDSRGDSALSDARSDKSEPAFSSGGDPSRERTLIFGEAAAAAPADFPYLVVVQGEEEGREIQIVQDELSIGRSAENDLVFPDIACSRQHAILERKGDDYVITDLGSGNGTQVNGKQVQQVVLQDSDEIEIGSTILRFHQQRRQGRGARTGGITTTRSIPSRLGGGFMADMLADPRRRKLILFGGGGVLGFLFLLALVKALSGPVAPPGPSPEEIRRQREEKARKELETRLESAKTFVTQKQWEEAKREIGEVLKIDGHHKWALEYQEYIDQESAAQQALQTARSFAKQKAWDNAIVALHQIGEESEYHEDALQLKKEIDEQRASDLLDQGKELMKAGEYAQAVLKFVELQKIVPDQEEAELLKRQAEEELAKEEKRVAALEKTKRVRSVAFERKKEAKPPGRGGLTGQLLALYKNGEIDKAIEKAEASESTEQLVKLKKFKGLYNRGMELSKNQGQIGSALKYLNEAMALDKDITGGSGKFNEELRSKLGKVYFIQGVDAHMKQNYPEAYKSYNLAGKYGYDRAKQRLEELEKIAKRLYEEAYVIKSSNPDQAVKKLIIVLQIVPPDHVYYSKAKRLSDSVQGPAAPDSEGDTGF